MCYVQGMSSCAVQEIVNLSAHKTPLDAMKDFCNHSIGTQKKDCKPNGGYNYDGYGKAKGNQGMYTEGLGDQYVFHGVESGEGDDPYGFGRTGYASRFAAFITENKLGEVIGGGRRVNHRYHPDHLCQVFIWNPDREAMFAWWNEHQEPKAVAAKPPVVIEAAPLPAVIEVEAKPVRKAAARKVKE